MADVSKIRLIKARNDKNANSKHVQYCIVMYCNVIFWASEHRQLFVHCAKTNSDFEILIIPIMRHCLRAFNVLKCSRCLEVGVVTAELLEQ